ncbi:DUF1343 domain-containing protein [Alteromonas sediminis]|uniref:DUF1343 domain-containing protein n=1 Tax=Alteromonas sediminis TaxID=2259342 RepID=A0A3N5XZE0_9ALTE|nr:DUF1343 domain-containing protein [Alteromonas sediminis]RPJ66647.1 DUF1343 domain-containing protein [Alteromonas sediminis]
MTKWLWCAIWVLLFLAGPSAYADSEQKTFLLGAERQDIYLPLLKDKRVGLVVNASSRVGQAHLVDTLLADKMDIVSIFAPEHGFRGDHDAGAKVESGLDPVTGIPIISIYGKNKKPQPDVLQNIDVIVFDIQDVGARFYTYISSMHYVMEAAAEQGIEMVVLDRPNPNGAFVDGPVREPGFESFVGMHPIPLLHGMTVAELARMIKGEKWINAAQELILHTVPMQAYQRQMPYSLPVPPSPNLPNDQSIQLYPSLCLFEPTVVSVGRGTDFPFQVIGHHAVELGTFTFKPRSIQGAASNPKLKGKTLFGIDLRNSDIAGLDLGLLFEVFKKFKNTDTPFFTSPDFFDKLAGTDRLRKQLEAGETWERVRMSWRTDLADFRLARQPYLLYP